MGFRSARWLPWLVPMLFAACTSAELVVQSRLEDPVPTLESAQVIQHTTMVREKREVLSFEQEEYGLDRYNFPEKMAFVIQAFGHNRVLNLTRNTYARSIIRSKTESKDALRYALYYSVESGASVLVECQNGICSLLGSLEIDGKLYHIEQDYSSNDFKSHTLQERKIPTIEELKKFLYQAEADGDSPIRSRSTLGRVRRRRSAIPDCDIIEVKALVDDTIWDFYKDRFGGDETRAEDEIEKYFESVFAEVDFRLKCLTSYFEAISNCGTDCLRVILVDVEISKTSSWTDGNMMCQNFPDGSRHCFVKGVNGLYKCGYLNTQMPNHATAWDMLMCFTRENIIMQEGGVWKDYFRTIAWRPSMCNSNKKYRTAISEAMGDGVDIQAAHSLLHALNAYNDEEKNCAPNEYFLMKEHMSLKTKNPAFWGQNWYLSGCMADGICTYIKGLNDNNKNCMRTSGSFDATIWHEWEKTPLPGEIYSTDQQCKDKWGNDSVQCDPTGQGNLFPEFMCSRHIWCTRNGSCVCQVRVSSGTPCGKAKICWKGHCIPTPDVPLGGTCDCHSQCADDNAVCDPDTCTCVCDEGYYDDNGDDVAGGNCTEKVPNGDPCTEDRECLDPNAICLNGTCECAECYYLNTNGTCIEQSCLGEPCSSIAQCKGANVICDLTDAICVCEGGYVVNDDGECDIVNSTLCDLCAGDLVGVEGDCYGTRVGENCTLLTDTCIDDFAICNGTFCVCLPGFTWNGSLCVGNDLCDPCDTVISTCVCSTDTYRCVCPPDRGQIDDACYGTRVTEPCTTILDSCIDDNAGCNGTVCDCLPGFVWNGSICVGTDLCDPCDPLTSACQLPFVCSASSYVCQCPSHLVQVDGDCYGTRVTEDCTTVLDTCIDDNAACNGTICDCLPGFAWNGSICVGTNLCDPCDPFTLPCDPGLSCNLYSYRCSCPTGYVQVGSVCVGTRVGEPCTTSTDTCIDDNAGCNGTICDCEQGFVWNGSICVGPDLCDPCDPYTSSCDSSLVCCPNTYRCQCPPDEVQISDACYGRLVTERCTTLLDTCIDDNAECNGTICDCVSGFTWNGSICVGSDLCDPCDPSTLTCDSTLVCSSDTYTCECPPDRVQVGDFCSGTLVTEPCTTTIDTCVDDNAECNGTVCDCIPGFFWNGSICVGPDLCDPCDPSIPSCDSTLVCSPDTYTCECPTGQVQIAGFCYGRFVTELCTSLLDTCVDDNAECNGTVCDCIAGFVWNGSICVGHDLCDPCDPNTPSCDSSLICSTETYTCSCPLDRAQVGDFCSGTRVTEPCTTTVDTCIDDNAECNGTICNCMMGFVWNGSICVGSDICDPCDTLTPSCDSSLVCSPDTYRCECPLDQVQIADMCYGRFVTEDCTTLIDTCVDDNAECNGTICDCISGFVWNGSICVGSDLCDPCDPSTPSCDSSLICSSNTYRCECPLDRVQIGDFCSGTRVTEPCTTILDTCIDDNAVCNGTVCDCMMGFIWNGSICVGADLCEPCDPYTSSCDSSLICSSDTYRCECPTHLVQIGDMCYGTRVTEECTTVLDTCIDDNAACNGTICDCLSIGFVWNGSICVGPDICDPCDPFTPSCDPPYMCNSNTYLCTCPSDQVQIGNGCYGTRVGESCLTSLDTCIDDNAECNGGTCTCISGFTWNGSICVGTDLCDPCDPSTPTCDSSLVCSSNSYRCECPTDELQIDDACYGRIVTERCTTLLDTCIDDNAECNGTICDCVSGFTWNGSICVGSDLCDPCDPSTPTCDSTLVCSSNTYTCECPPDQVQVGDFCSGTLVTEPCTTIFDVCVDDNAVCNGTICDCIPGFVWNGSICIGSGLWDPCDPSLPSCDSTIVCNPDTYRCECPIGEVQIGDVCYGRFVTEQCTSSLDTCVDDNAECNGTVCDCISGFVWNGSICVGQDLCDPCDPSTPSCDSSLVCSSDTYRCECPPDEVQIGGFCYGRFVTESCTLSLDTCVDDNAICNGTICDCIPGFIWNGSICVGPDLCDPCDPNTPSCDSSLVCSAGTCQCPPSQVQIGDSCYGRRVTEPCTPLLDTCIDDNAGCNGSICDCNAGLYWNGFKCIGSGITNPCVNESCAAPFVCSNDSVCVCPATTVQIMDSCFGRLVTEICTPFLDTCIDDNAGCNGTVCDCLSGYVWNGSICVGTELCDPCDVSTPTCSSTLVCSPDTYRCECPPDEVQVDDMCVGTHVTESCTSLIDTCIDDNAECNGTVCDCVTGFSWNGSICVGTDLCDPCDPSASTCDSSLVCSPDTYRCECPLDRVQIEDMCYGTLVTEVCTTILDTCTDDNAECNGTICDCMPGFVWNGSICVGTDLCDPCDPLASTCGSPLVCNPDLDTCVCPPGMVQIVDECYGTLVTEVCTTSLDTCVDDNAECNGTVCDCVAGFTWIGSICVGTDLCDPCDPSTPTCDSSLVCSPNTYRCQCPSDQVEIEAACYGTRVTESCTTVLDTCIDDNAECNGTVCNCMMGFIWNGSICVGSDLCDACDPSASTCDAGLFCSPDTYKCQCALDRVQIGDMCYGTLVTEPCTTLLDTCIDDNAECNGTVCVCIIGFVWNGSICVGSDLCDPCDPSASTCDSSLVCNPNTYRCECPSDQVQIGDFCSGTLVTEQCTTVLDTCIDDNAICNGTICDCIPGFTWNGSICVGVDLCDPCDPSASTCDSSLVCSPDTYRCECPTDQVQIGDMCYGRQVTEPCTSVLDTCIDDYAECNGTICDCIPGFIWNGSVCVGTDLCDPCDPSTPSCDSSLVCSPDTYRCECPPDRVQIADMCYGTRVSEDCTTSIDTCIDDNAVCNGSICDCISGFTWNGSICVGPDLCDPCDPSTPSCDSSLVCSSDTYRCECPPGEVQLGDTCYGRLVGETCTLNTDTCIDDYAACNGTICDCLPGFIWNGSRCVGTDLCDPCDPSTPSCDSSLTCSPDTYRCSCPPTQVQIGDICSGTRVTEPCTTILDTCIDDNAACNGTVCDCVLGFSWNGSICVGSDLCDPCDPSASTCDSSLECSPDLSLCVCPSGFLQIGDFCYGRFVTEVCTSLLDTCVDDNAECNGTVCDCIPGFVWNGSICVGSDLCDPCDPLTPSCDSSLICSSDTYRCQCPLDRVQIGDFCSGTRVTEPCTTVLDTCIDDSAACNGTVCDCMMGFVWNGSICVGADLCDPCDPSTVSCDSSLVCSPDTYTCVCPPDEVQINDACYGRLVTERCTTTLDTCIDDNAGCNGTVCDCNLGFIWNGSICVGSDLCDPCDPSTPSCDSSLVCSATTYRCSCPPNRVQYDDECVGTRVTEPCSPILDTCIDDNAECNGTICDCMIGFVWNGSICVGTYLCDPCDPSNSTCAPDYICDPDNDVCVCPPDTVQVEDVCYGRLVTEPCTTVLDTCIDDNAECNGSICDCQTGFTWNGSICVGSELCDPCDPSLPTCAGGLVCSSSSYVCQCPSNKIQIGDACYGTLIGESCTTSLDSCIDDNAACIVGTCACIPPFTWNGTLQICVGTDLDDPCDSDSCGSGLVCGATSGNCECETPPVQIDNACYGTLIGEVCTAAEDTCIDDYAECSGGVCACVAGFTWNSTICVGTELDDPCDNSPASCAANGLVCGPTDKCECPDDEVQFDNMCYVLTCGSCVNDSDCLGANQTCVGSICECLPGFYLDNCGICQPEIPTGGSCSSDEQCESGICACDECVDSLDDDCCEDCDDIRADIVVITDNAGAAPSSYKDRIDFALTLTNAFTIGPNDIKIGLVDYGNSVYNGNSFNIGQLTNSFEITFELLSNNAGSPVTRRTHLAIERAEVYFNTAARAQVPNYVVVILGDDSCCSASLQTALNDLNTIGNLTIYAVGLNDAVTQAELDLIASDTSKTFSYANTTTVDSIVAGILDDSCVDGLGLTTVAPTTTTPPPTTTDD